MSEIKEAVERLAEFETLSVETGAGYALLHVYGPEEDEPPAALGLSADLRTLLSALQKAREALGPFADACDSADEGAVDNHAHCWESAMAMAVTYGDFRRAAEVYGALSPGGADE